MEFDLWRALGVFISDFIFWFLTIIYVRSANDNFIIKTALVVGAVNASDFSSKYFASQCYSNIIVAYSAGLLGAGVAMLYDRWRKKKQMRKSKLIIFPAKGAIKK